MCFWVGELFMGCWDLNRGSSHVRYVLSHLGVHTCNPSSEARQEDACSGLPALLCEFTACRGHTSDRTEGLAQTSGSGLSYWQHTSLGLLLGESGPYILRTHSPMGKPPEEL